MKLYDISGSDIIAALHAPDMTAREHTKIIAIKKFGRRFSGLPLKVVYEKKEDEIFIVTTYPLKKKLWR
jgi:hypothetical protein